jgi:Ca-activated chloride channel family protein
MRAQRAAALVFLLLAGSFLPVAAQEAGPRYLGTPLAEALADLQERGLSVIFSSDLVRPGMRVRSEPTATSLHRVLDQLLAPHGLKAQVGPRGTVLVVLKEPEPILVAIEQPSPFQSIFSSVEVQALVMTEEPIREVEFFVDGQSAGSLDQPPFHLVVPVGEENTDRVFRVEAHGAWGGYGEASVTTQRVEIEDQFEVALKQLFVTVDQGNRRVLDLGRENFTVFDGGVRQTLVTFERGDVPISAVLMLDASESMKGRYLEAALTGSHAFLSSMNPLDRAMVMLFADRALAVTPFSGDASVLAKGLEGVFAGGGTALNDHLYASLRLLDRTQGRRVVILLSDGADVLSALRMSDVLWKVRRSDALIYWIRLERDNRDFSSAWRGFEENRREWEGLEKAVEESGGRIRVLSGIDEIGPAFEEIMTELRGQYVLGYYPTKRRAGGSWRPVRVKVNVPSTRVRFRAGYIDN